MTITDSAPRMKFIWPPQYLKMVIVKSIAQIVRAKTDSDSFQSLIQ